MPDLETRRPANSARRLVCAAGFLLAGLSPTVAAAPLVPPDILAPHRAIYDLSLLESRDRAGVVSIEGRLVYEFARKGCDEFALTYRLAMSVNGRQGAGGLVDFRSNTVEDDGATDFSFHSTSQMGGQIASRIGGLAERGEGGGIDVTLEQPQSKTLTLPAGVMFPTQHLRRILAAARAGEFSVEANVFDGGDPGDEASPSLALIGTALQPNEQVRDEVAAGASLDKLPRWPVMVSYFASTSARDGEQTPKFVFSAEIYENGISQNLKLDYGAYIVAGRLVALERLPAGECPR